MDGRSVFTVVGLQVLMLIIWAAPAVSQTGYLSIDCGSDVNYTDSTTGIHWVTDAGYISTGKNAQSLSVVSNDPLVNKRQAGTLRYFDEGRSRDCYVLPMTPGRTYIVRPTFYFGNWQNGSSVNAFYVFLNATNWISLGYLYSEYDIQDETYSEEAIVYSPGSQLNFCLVRDQGTPFISSLELRELSSGMYAAEVGNNSFLYLETRLNCGPPQTAPAFIRYPDDPYDRIWSKPGLFDNSTHISRTNISSWSSTLAPDQPPVKVMEDAWVFYGQSILWYSKEYGFPIPYPISVHSYFQELDGNASASNVRGMEYYFNSKFITSFNSSDQPLEIKGPVQDVTGSVINISFVQANWSKLNPILNALEIYFVLDLNASATMTEDAYTIAALQTQLSLTDWDRGDPCFPVPYDWLNCSTNITSRVTHLFLQNISMTGAVPPEISNLTALTYLNLSNNGLTTFPTTFSFKGNFSTLTVLDVSHNNFNGDVGGFLEDIGLATIQEIHAAENQFEGQIPVDLLVDQGVTAKIVNFDQNYISGTLDLLEWHISFLKATRAGNLPTLQLLSLIDNNITDIYPNLDDLTPAIEALLKSGNRTFLNTGILLGGNPWCKQAKSMSLSQQYLCRSNTNDVIFETKRAPSSWSRKKLGITIGTSVGAVILLVSSICFTFLWKLRKQGRALHEIQEALAKQRVQPPFYSYAELRAATREFCLDSKLGQGAFGAVYRAALADGTILAVKKLFPSKLALTEFLNEVVLITGIKHRNLVQLKGCCIKEQRRLLVYEYAENGNLAEALWDATSKKDGEHQKETKLDWTQRFNVCVGVARGLAYLHEELQPRIIHRDIKPANILMDKNLNPKIADFGLARAFLDDESRADYTNLAGTPGYCAPEYVIQGQLTEKVDVFSFGVLVLEIVSGRPCINRKLPSEKVSLLNWIIILRNEERLLDLLEPGVQEITNEEEAIRVINIALLCVNSDPARRPRMSHVVTMLLGSMDVTVFLDSPHYNLPDYKSLLAPPGQSARHSKLDSNLETLNEESDEHSLMDMDFTNMNSTFSSNGAGSLLMTELSGRS